MCLTINRFKYFDLLPFLVLLPSLLSMIFPDKHSLNKT